MYYLSVFCTISVRDSRDARCQIVAGRAQQTKLKTVARWRWRQHNYRRAAVVKLCAILNARIINVVVVIIIIIMWYSVSLILRREWHNNNTRWADNILVFRPRSRNTTSTPTRPLIVRAGYYKIIKLRIKSFLRYEMSNIPPLLLYRGSDCSETLCNR